MTPNPADPVYRGNEIRCQSLLVWKIPKSLRSKREKSLKVALGRQIGGVHKNLTGIFSLSLTYAKGATIQDCGSWPPCFALAQCLLLTNKVQLSAMNKIVESERCQCCCRKDLIHAPETDRRHKMPEKPGTCAHAEIKEDEVGSGSLGKARARHHGK